MKTIKAWAVVDEEGNLITHDNYHFIVTDKVSAKGLTEVGAEGERVVRVTIPVEEE